MNRPAAISAKNERIDFVLFSLCVALCYLLLNGYSFNAGDLSEHLPQVYRKLNPALYPNDFFVTYALGQFTVRDVWVTCVTALSAVMPVHTVCFVLHLLCLTLTILAWMRITRIVAPVGYAPHISVVIIFLLVNKLTVGGNTLMGNSFYSSIPAEMLASWAVYAALHRKTLLSAAACGLALWFQAIVGVHMALLLAVYFWAGRASLKQAVIFSLMFAGVAAPVLGQLIYTYVWQCLYCDKIQYYTLLYEYRAFLHYLPHLFPATHYLYFILLMLAAAYAVYMQREAVRMFAVFVLTCVFFCVAYTILIYTVWPGSGMLQAFKTTVWLNALCGVALGIHISRVMQRWVDMSIISHKWLTGAVAVLLFGVLTQSAYLPWEKLHSRYQVGRYVKTDLQQMHEWIRLHTPVQAMFITDPSDDSFSCEAQRSMPVNYKAVVHDPAYMQAWWQRMQQYYAVSEKQLAGNVRVVDAAIHNYHSQYIAAVAATCDYALMQKTKTDARVIAAYGNAVYETDYWILIQLNKN